MSDDKNLDFLRELAKRGDANGVFELHGSEMPFVHTLDGRLWLKQAELGTHRFQLSDHGKAVLR